MSISIVFSHVDGVFLVRRRRFELPLTPLQYYALEERSGTGAVFLLRQFIDLNT